MFNIAPWEVTIVGIVTGVLLVYYLMKIINGEH